MGESASWLDDRRFENFIDGEFGTIGSSEYEVASPFDDEYVVTFADSSLADTPRAISAAGKAIDETSELTYDERRSILKDAADDWDWSTEEKEYLAKMLGAPLKSLDFKIDQGQDTLEYLPLRTDVEHTTYAGDIAEKKGPGMYEVYKNIEEPLSAFLPANDPSVAPYVLGYTVLTGNAAVVRPSSEEAYSALKTAEALTEAGYPDGGLNIILYDSSDESNEAHRQNMIDGTRGSIVFGGDDTVQDFADAAGNDIRKNFIGFGEGRANAYVFDDADIPAAVDSIVEGMTLWPNGCNATKAVRVAPDVYDEFTGQLTEALDDLVIGDPMDEDTDIGYLPPETIDFLAERGAAREVSSADEIVYPATDEEVQLNGDGLDLAVTEHDGAPIQMQPLVVAANDERSEFMTQEHPGYVLGVAEVAQEDLPERYAEAYTDNEVTPITFSYYTDRKWTEPFSTGLTGQRRALLNDVPAHLNNHNDSTIQMNPFLRHQGMDLLSEMTRSESNNTVVGPLENARWMMKYLVQGR